MLRRINVEILQATWPPPPGPPAFPATFHQGIQQTDVDFPAMLLGLGRLTTPASVRGISLAEYWAYVRYFNAVTSDLDLRLTEDFAKLDAHQKTILSDDFGVGIPMHWLEQHLGLLAPCDGRYFIDILASTVGAAATNTAKRGPNKSPDFVALDNQGTWHVVECKGTQSGAAYRDKQLYGSNTVAGAQLQKRSITFPPGHTGQRLACGLSIGLQGKPGTTTLKIIDPPPDEESFEVEPDYLDAAKSIVLRSSLAISLKLAGFPTASNAVASPIGPTPQARRSSGSTETARESFVENRREAALSEISQRNVRSIFYNRRRRYYGRELVQDLPLPILTDTGEVRRIRVRQGVSADLLNLLKAEEFPDTLEPDSTLLREAGSAVRKIEKQQETTELLVGDSFFSRVDLEKK